jgi:4-amino-4-deoxy-L-arabinose transferase-like glycosyltransferase
MLQSQATSETRPTGGDRRRWVFPLVLVALCGVLYFWFLGATPLEDFDEAYYAIGAREMLARHDLGTPYMNGVPFLQKPVLIYWLIAASFAVFGQSEFSARLLSALLGTGLVLFTYFLGTRLLNRRAGFLAGLALALNYMWIGLSRDASIDIPLVALLTPALFTFYLATRETGARARRLYLVGYPLLGLALLAKGPVPVVAVTIGVVAYLLAARRLRSALREMRLLPGLLLLLAVAVPWYWYELRLHPEFWRIFFIGEHFGHIGGVVARKEPVWGNLRYLLTYFFPWVAFLPGAFVYTFRQTDREHVLRFCSWQVIAVVALFSLPQSKLAHYLAPAFPALALLVGAWLDAWLKHEAMARWPAALGRALLGVFGGVCLLATALLLAPPPFVAQRLAKFGSWQPGPSVVVMLGVLALGFLVAALLGGRWRGVVVPALSAAMFVAGLAFVGGFWPHRALIEALPRWKLARYAAAVLPPSEPFGVYYAKRNSTIFYLGRPIVDLGEWDAAKLQDFLASGRPVAALTHRRFLPELQRGGRPVFVLRESGDYVLVANHPAG